MHEDVPIRISSSRCWKSVYISAILNRLETFFILVSSYKDWFTDLGRKKFLFPNFYIDARISYLFTDFLSSSYDVVCLCYFTEAPELGGVFPAELAIMDCVANGATKLSLKVFTYSLRIYPNYTSIPLGGSSIIDKKLDQKINPKIKFWKIFVDPKRLLQTPNSLFLAGLGMFWCWEKNLIFIPRKDPL